MANTYVQIGNTVTVGAGGASTIAFSSIPSTYTDLVIKISARSTIAGTRQEIYWNINSDTSSSNYSYTRLIGYDSGSTFSSSYSGVWTDAGTAIDASTATANTFSNTELYLSSYAASVAKRISGDWVAENNSSSAWIAGISVYLWNNTSAINSISFTTGGGNFAQYSTASLYGIKSS